MRLNKGKIWTTAIVIIGCLLLWSRCIPTKNGRGELTDKEEMIPNSDLPNAINVVMVACGSFNSNLINSIKSILLTSDTSIQFHIFTDQKRYLVIIKEMLVQYAFNSKIKMKVNFHKVSLPSNVKNHKVWLRLFKPCATLRLFLTDLLPDIESVIYLDTDVLLLQPISKLYNERHKFKSHQIIAAAKEHEIKERSSYYRYTAHPHYGEMGLNSGVLIMNLERMREVNFIQTIQTIYQRYNDTFRYGDQDILNIYFHSHPDMMYVLDCSFNYRTDHFVRKTNVCQGADRNNGIAILHGTRSVYRRMPQHIFSCVSRSIMHSRFDRTGKLDIRKNLRNYFKHNGFTNSKSSQFVLAQIILNSLESK